MENDKLKLAIVGYGNLGKAAEKKALFEGHEVVGIFTRRDPREVVSPYGTRTYRYEDIFSFSGEIDVALVCLGSAGDTVGAVKRLAEKFNTADTFDTHSKIAEYLKELDGIAKKSGRLSLISAGWDPGLFSVMRALFYGVLGSEPQTFWGRGVSQGHGEAIRRIEGVKDAVQYTIPIKGDVDAARMGIKREGAGHTRECFVVAEEGADEREIERKIKTMPDYFAPYETKVTFVDEKTLRRDHSAMPHAGRVIGVSPKTRYRLEFSLEIDSNPDFTASVLLCYAAAQKRMFDLGVRGAITVLDVPIFLLADGGVKFL